MCTPFSPVQPLLFTSHFTSFIQSLHVYGPSIVSLRINRHSFFSSSSLLLISHCTHRHSNCTNLQITTLCQCRLRWPPCRAPLSRHVSLPRFLFLINKSLQVQVMLRFTDRVLWKTNYYSKQTVFSMSFLGIFQQLPQASGSVTQIPVCTNDMFKISHLAKTAC